MFLLNNPPVFFLSLKIQNLKSALFCMRSVEFLTVFIQNSAKNYINSRLNGRADDIIIKV